MLACAKGERHVVATGYRVCCDVRGSQQYIRVTSLVRMYVCIYLLLTHHPTADGATGKTSTLRRDHQTSLGVYIIIRSSFTFFFPPLILVLYVPAQGKVKI